MIQIKESEPIVTIVVVPRERFSHAQESLESIYEHTKVPFKLIYVDGRSPKHLSRYFQEMALEKSFRLIRKDYYLYPNQARNIGLKEVNTPYVVFIDNDVVVAPGWLKALIDCAEKTKAAVISPLNCEKMPLHHIIHFAGGKTGIVEEKKNGNVERHLIDVISKQGREVSKVRKELKREPTGCAEFHCVMVRKSIFDKIGPFDENMYSTKENLDFCMSVTQAGGTIYFEPDSVITYKATYPMSWYDIPYYVLRWNDAWILASLHHLRDKWNLTEDIYFQKRYRDTAWRRKMFVIRPFFRHLPFWKIRNFFETLVLPIDKIYNRLCYKQYLRAAQNRKLK